MTRKRIRPTRGQTNKKVRQILLRYQIDLSQLSFSTSASSIFFSGYLLKNNGNDVPAHTILCLVQELAQIGEIRSELHNWFISNDTIYYLGGEMETELMAA